MPMCFWFFSQVSGHLRGSPESNFLFNHRHKISCAFFAGQNTCAFIWRNSPICQYSKLKNKNCIQSLKHISLFHIFFVCMLICVHHFSVLVSFSLFSQGIKRLGRGEGGRSSLGGVRGVNVGGEARAPGGGKVFSEGGICFRTQFILRGIQG